MDPLGNMGDLEMFAPRATVALRHGQNMFDNTLRWDLLVREGNTLIRHDLIIPTGIELTVEGEVILI